MTATLLDVAEGAVVGRELVTIVGRRTDADTTEDDVWSGGEGGGVATRVLPSSAGAMSLVSSDIADAAAGTGARSVEVDYLDASHERQTVVVTLNGATPVVTTETAIRVQRARVKTAGTGRVNAGAISVSIGGNVQAHIPAGLGESPQALWTIPAGYFALLRDEWVESAAAATGRLYQLGPAGDSSRQLVREHRTTAPHGGAHAPSYTRLEQKTDLMLRAAMDGGSGHVVAGFSLVLVAI